MPDLAGVRSQGGDHVNRQRRPVRLWNWLNAIAMIAMVPVASPIGGSA